MNPGGHLPTLAFDLDGVLLDSEAVKLRCFRDAFSALGPTPAALAEIDRANTRDHGLPREQKVRAYLAAFAPELPLERVLDSYAARLAAELGRT